jgi:hypothetical protein
MAHRVISRGPAVWSLLERSGHQLEGKIGQFGSE